MISIRGGKISANVDELTAPTKEMIGPRFGTKAAKITANIQKLMFSILKLNIRLATKSLTCKHDHANA